MKLNTTTAPENKHTIITWILKHRKPVKCICVNAYAKWRRTKWNYIVRRTFFGEVLISTVFIGFDLNFVSNGKPSLSDPIFFETMIFYNGYTDYCKQCSTWREALAMHKAAIKYFNSL